jgi:ABC-type nickel/cobalt efflux system permease component RcnA
MTYKILIGIIAILLISTISINSNFALANAKSSHHDVADDANSHHHEDDDTCDEESHCHPPSATGATVTLYIQHITIDVPASNFVGPNISCNPHL